VTVAQQIDELRLVQVIRERAAGHDVAFAELFAAYRQRVFTICRHLTRSRADAEDVTQEVFVALLRALPGFRGESSLATFIHRIAVRLAIKQRLRTIRHDQLRVTHTAPATDAHDARETNQRLWLAMEQLSIEQRTVLALFAVDGLSHREIAAVLGIPEGTVWSRLHSARKRLSALVSA
jgi:RNA polymerase sigma-70 factor, ECF subfamily